MAASGQAAAAAGGAASAAEEPSYSKYLAAYSGHGLQRRLIHIARTQPELATTAFKQAIDAVKEEGWNVSLYQSLVTEGGDAIADTHGLDAAWIEDVGKRVKVRSTELERDLNQGLANQVRDNIRGAHMAMAQFYYARGEHNNAMKCVMRAREYTPAPQMAENALWAMKIAISAGHYDSLDNFVKRAQATSAYMDAEMEAKVKAVSGLERFARNDFRGCANAMLSIDVRALGNSLNDILSARDVATLGGLCALASFGRGALKKRVLEDMDVKRMLGGDSMVLSMVHRFYRSDYSSVFASFESLRARLCLDPLIEPRLDRLYRAVRSRAIVQFFIPFSSVDLAKMAAKFNTGLEEMEGECARLIFAGELEARIDSNNKVLVSKHSNQRAATFQKAFEAADSYVREARALLLRASLEQQQVQVLPDRRQE